MPHMHPSQADALEGPSKRQLIQPSYGRSRPLTYIIRDHKAFPQFAFEMFTLGKTTYSDSVYCLHVDLVTFESFQ